MTSEVDVLCWQDIICIQSVGGTLCEYNNFKLLHHADDAETFASVLIMVICVVKHPIVRGWKVLEPSIFKFGVVL